MDQPSKPKRSGPKVPRQKRKKTHPKRARHGESNYFAKLAQTEEGRAQIREWQKRAGRGRKVGVPDGHTAAEMEIIRAHTAAQAERIMQVMEQEGLIEPVVSDADVSDDASLARKALRVAVQIMLEPSGNRDKLAAARTVLEYTKVKPATQSNVAISSAESFLAELAAKDQK